MNAPAGETLFHAGELEIQTRAGVRERMDAGARRFIRDHLIQQHRDFFAQLPFVVLGMLDGDADPWASILVGPAGFMSSPDERRLHIGAQLARGHPLTHGLAAGANAGLLGIEFHTQRRNRANGVIEAVDESGFLLAVRQSFGNCPKYIVPQNLAYAPGRGAANFTADESALLSERATQLIRRAHTFFIATAARPAAQDPREACDVSHRGGEPGFVSVTQGAHGSVLTIPDYRGNNLFNTFGNVLMHPRAGLAFADFAAGTVLSLTGAARVILTPHWRGLEFMPRMGGW